MASVLVTSYGAVAENDADDFVRRRVVRAGKGGCWSGVDVSESLRADMCVDAGIPRGMLASSYWLIGIQYPSTVQSNYNPKN